MSDGNPPAVDASASVTPVVPAMVVQEVLSDDLNTPAAVPVQAESNAANTLQQLEKVVSDFMIEYP